jgi:hypothetical protein
MGSLPGSGLNHCGQRLIPAIFEPALEFRSRVRPVALQHIQCVDIGLASYGSSVRMWSVAPEP